MKLQSKPIDYTLLGEACNYYKGLGYKQIETPWIVSPEANGKTYEGETDYAFALKDDRELVCSAEQGFVQMWMDGNLKLDKMYFSVSPCFRNEVNDATHSKWFMKLELCKFSHCASEFGLLLSDAHSFFDDVGHVVAQVVPGNSLDLMAGDLEIGSYGSREMSKGLYLNYGTGLALPRFTLAQERNG